VKKYLVLNGFDWERSRIIQQSIGLLFGSKYQFLHISQVPAILKSEEKVKLVFIIYIEKDSISTRKLIWQIKVRFENHPFILCSENRDIANLAWQINSIHFLPYPLSRRSIALMVNKAEQLLTPHQSKIKFNFQGGCDIISPEEICYCAGDGNYTRIFLKGTRIIMLSKKIKEISAVLSPFPDLVRIGKSFIVNINNIQRVDELEVSFRGLEGKNAIQFSPLYLKRIKEQLLWLVN
jgi:DNA-binding LytR/AlgR family response regulator